MAVRRLKSDAKVGSLGMAEQSLFRTIGTKDRLVDQVANDIMRLIVEGHLAPGARLPGERELAREIGVSRTVIREAVRILAAKGLLETRQGIGTTVLPVTRDQVVEPLSLLVQIQEGGVAFEDLHQVRSILEVEIAGLAAAQATDADIANLRRIMSEMEVSQEDPDLFAVQDTEFHQALGQMTHNPILRLLLGVIRDLLQDYMTQVTRHINPAEQVLPYHSRILETIAAHDEQSAREAMRAHLHQVRLNHIEAFHEIAEVGDI